MCAFQEVKCEANKLTPPVVHKQETGGGGEEQIGCVIPCERLRRGEQKEPLALSCMRDPLSAQSHAEEEGSIDEY